ncbi:MAG TPA: peptidyl-alpha-hydroxyglycine alpha-amidating lyase family protein [Bacteroidia bacterium]|jgi:peptidylamidoglycolate lyase|nr:peptidyl-alpha-hydroxyglycine alpha-amidating lyase family protein [Bacteroidia bacterium]
MNKRLLVKLTTPLLALSILLSGCGTEKEKKQESSTSSYELVKDWPQLGSNYQLGNPTGIGIDSEQHIFVFNRAYRKWREPFTDSLITANTILKLDRNTGKLLDSWGANLFIMPHGLTVDQDNNIWVTDVALHQVFKFDAHGKLLMKLGIEKVAGDDSLHFNLPTDVAVAADRSFYVSDGYGNNRVVKFSATGHYQFEWGKKGNKPGEFNLPHGISLDEKGNVYVADRENSRVQSFSPDGKFLQTWDNKNQGAIYSVAFDKRVNKLIAVDYLTLNDTIVKGSDIMVYDSLAQEEHRFGKSSTPEGPVSRYHDVAVDDEGNIYVGDIRGNTIQKFKKVK